MATKLAGANGYLYEGALGSTADTAPALTSASFYMITGKAASGSALPSTLSTGDVFYQKTSDIPVDSTAAFSSNDAVKKFTLTKLAFVTDVGMSISREKFDETVQNDTVRSYQVSSKPEKTGTIGGYWIDKDTNHLNFVKQMDAVIVQTTTGGVTKTSPATTARYLFLSRDETTANTAIIYEYIPAVIDSVQSDKPMEGPESFSFTYTAQGSLKPATIVVDN